MYHIYLRDAEGRVIGGVSHPETRDAAQKAFSNLVNQTELDGHEVAVVLVEHKHHCGPSI